MRSLAWSPRWLFAHVVVLAAVVGFASLGLWQLRRLEERRAANELIRDRMAQEAVPFAEASVLPEEAASYRRVTVSGIYDPAGELLLVGRSRAGRPGHHLLTPVDTDSGRIVVDRGWIPLEWDQPPVRQALPPSAPVTLTGLLLPGRQGGAAATDGRGDRLNVVRAVDLDRIGDAFDQPVFHHYLALQTQRPPQPGELPAPPEPPDLSEGPHLSYAAQWFLFAAVVSVGYPLLLRKVARDRGRGEDAPQRIGDAPGS